MLFLNPKCRKRGFQLCVGPMTCFETTFSFDVFVSLSFFLSVLLFVSIIQCTWVSEDGLRCGVKLPSVLLKPLNFTNTTNTTLSPPFLSLDIETRALFYNLTLSRLQIVLPGSEAENICSIDSLLSLQELFVRSLFLSNPFANDCSLSCM